MPAPLRPALGLALMLLVLLLPAAAATAPLEVVGARLGAYPDKTRVVFDLSAPPAGFQAFALSAPPRVVVDLPALAWRTGALNPGGGVAALRAAQRPERGQTRLVLDLEGPMEVGAAFVLPAGGGRPDRLVLDLVPAQAGGAARGAVHGTLPPETAIAPAAPAPKPARHRVVLDPGHGGRDPGAVSGRIYEKDITLALARELAAQLRADGRYEVFLTRTDDRAVALHDRVAFARARGADLFVSLHADSIGRPGVRGASVYTLSETASDAQTEMLAARENRADIIAGLDLTGADAQVTSILIDLATRDAMNKAGFVAEALVERLGAGGVPVLDNPHRYAGFAVLKAPDVPSVLVEAGFLSNRAEARALSDPGHRRTIARAIKSGIDAYFAKLRAAGHP